MQRKYGIMKLLFRINIRTQSGWHCGNFDLGKYSKNISLFDFQELQLKSVMDIWFVILNIYPL